MNTDFISIDVPLSTAPTSPSLDAAGSSRTHPNSNEIEPTWASPSTTFVIAQVIKAVVVFIGRLWVAYLFISLLYMMVHQIPTSISNPLSPNEHPAIGYHLKVLNSDVRMRVTRIYGIPALFGSSLKRPLYAPLLLLKGIDGCHSFETNFPNTSLLMNAVTSMDPDWNRVVSEAQNATLDLPWIGMMPRGGCPFDTKVFNIQQSGFKGAIIYNDETLPYSQNRPDIGIRMATFLKGDQVEILAMFLRRFDSSQLLEALRQAKSDPPILILKIAPADWNYRIGNVSLSDLLQDMIAFLIDLSLFACTFLGGCFGLALLRNVMVYHRLMLVETLISGSDFLLSSDTIVYPAPKLVSIPFPKRILGPGDITSMNDDTPSIASSRKISNTCCAVCIEDYEEGDTVRDLPCGHIYHAGCIDQWLLKHNRLCPVCKQDVLEPPASHLSTAGEAPSEETIMVTVTSDSTGGSSSIGSESLFLRLRGLCRGLEWIGALTRRSRRRFFLALRDLTNTGTPASSSVTPGNNETELSSAATTNSRYL